MNILETERLSIRHLTVGDAPFILELLNEPAFIKNIADRGVRTLEDAVGYIEHGPRASYAKFGFGLFCVILKETETPIGMCGLLKRETLDDVDIGYALLERYWGKGYASEAAAGVMAYGHHTLGINRIVAITAPHNEGSKNVLTKLGLHFEKMVRIGHDREESCLFVPPDEE